MVRRLLFLCLVVSALSAAAPFATRHSFSPALASEAKECTVYVTRTGAKYHRAGCSSLRYSSRTITRSEAISLGYTACLRCGGSSCE